MDDFNDSLDSMFGGPVRPVQERLPDTRTNEQKAAEVIARSANKPAVFNDKCPKCIGGFWKGNHRFPCFACKGKGVLSFKTSPEARAKARAKATEKRIEREADKAAWREEHKAEIAWATRAAARNTERGGTFDFPAKLLESLEQWGTWTDGQLAAVQKLMARDQARKAELAQTHSAIVDASKIEAAFAIARERASRPGMVGIWTRPLKMRAGNLDLTFQPGSIGSRWEHQIFVRQGEKKLGTIEGGSFKRRFECSDAETAAVIEACQDPAQAAVAFGKAWGVCSACGRTLTDDESIARGIGPICAENFGW